MSLSAGAKVGIAVAIVGSGILGSAMVAFYYFRRRRRMERAAGRNDDMIPRGRLMTEKPLPPRPKSSSGDSEELEEPILQAVFDGFPGSTGYDDVRSLYSSPNLNSPTLPHSPSLSSSRSGHGFYSSESRERNELSAARLHSAPIVPTVVSYGPNPVTPTLHQRPSARLDYTQAAESISTDSRDGILPMPALNSMPSYASFHTYPDYSTPAAQSQTTIKQTAPIIVSYGPNRVTPTPTVTRVTVPPDEAIIKRMKPLAAVPRPATSAHERQFSFDDEFDQLDAGCGTMVPLPPYASTADFYAMEKGAIRKLAEPRAEAELPPTKDGFYHFSADITEYELPGNTEPYAASGPPSHRHRAGPGGDIDEQKFLLSDVEIARLREQKIKARQERAGASQGG